MGLLGTPQPTDSEVRAFGCHIVPIRCLLEFTLLSKQRGTELVLVLDGVGTGRWWGEKVADSYGTENEGLFRQFS